MKKIIRWEILGAVFIIILGTLFHFVYEWSGESRYIAVFGTVNESVWEHFKLVFWPAVFWALLEIPFLRRDNHNFAFAKGVGILVMPLIIMVIFYSYTGIIGRSMLVIDLLTFVIAVIMGQFLSEKLLLAKPMPQWWNYLAVVLVVMLAISFVVFTFAPPQLPLFKDSKTGQYGLG